MPNYAAKEIARMLARRALSREEALAALRLVSVAGRALEPMGPARHRLAGAGHGRSANVNHREHQLVGRIAGRRLFQTWQREMRRRGRDPDIAVAVLLWGETLSALDRRSRRRKGWARRELRQGIVIFLEVISGQAKETDLDRAGQREYQIG